MKKLLTKKIPSIHSCLIISAIAIVLVGYTAFKTGEIHGRNKLTKNIRNNNVHLERETSDLKEKKRNRVRSNPIYNKIIERYKKTNVQALVTTKTPEAIYQKRKDLIYFLWGTSNLPIKKMPRRINTAFYDERYKALYEKSLAKINHVLIGMEFNLQSNVYHFIPQKKNGRLVIFHQGHWGDFIQNTILIEKLLTSGYSVAAFCMPLIGLNNRPIIHEPRIGALKLINHNCFMFLTPKKGHPVKYFLEPVVVFLNYASKKYEDVSMIGISGGGWTATLVSAIDDRIAMSFPVAGSYPIYLRSLRDWGDYEETLPELYRTCNYLELYIMGAFGRGRSQLQIINRYDEICFSGIKWKTYYGVLKDISDNMDEVTWDLFMDETHTSHIISPKAQSIILAKLKR